jgi:hypothetical protein
MMYRVGDGCSRRCHLDAGESCADCEYFKDGRNYKTLFTITATGQLSIAEAADRRPAVLRR